MSGGSGCRWYTSSPRARWQAAARLLASAGAAGSSPMGPVAGMEQSHCPGSLLQRPHPQTSGNPPTLQNAVLEAPFVMFGGKSGACWCCPHCGGDGVKPLSPCCLGEWPRMDTCGPGRWQGGGTVAWPHLGRPRASGMSHEPGLWDQGTVPWVPPPNPPGSQCPPSPAWAGGCGWGLLAARLNSGISIHLGRGQVLNACTVASLQGTEPLCPLLPYLLHQ